MKKILCWLFGHTSDEGPVYEGIVIDQYRCARCSVLYWQHPIYARIQLNDDDPRIRREL